MVVYYNILAILAIDLKGAPRPFSVTGCKSLRHNDNDDRGVSFVSGTVCLCRARYVRSRSHPVFHQWFVAKMD